MSKKPYTSYARLSSIITILPSSMAAGWILGYFAVDRPFGVYPWGSIIFLLLGAGAGFYQIVKLLTEQRRDDER